MRRSDLPARSIGLATEDGFLRQGSRAAPTRIGLAIDRPCNAGNNRLAGIEVSHEFRHRPWNRGSGQVYLGPLGLYRPSWSYPAGESGPRPAPKAQHPPGIAQAKGLRDSYQLWRAATAVAHRRGSDQRHPRLAASESTWRSTQTLRFRTEGRRAQSRLWRWLVCLKPRALVASNSGRQPELPHGIQNPPLF